MTALAQEPDFTVYRRSNHIRVDERGHEVVHSEDEVTDATVDEESRRRILALPQLRHLRIYDGPQICGAIVFYQCPTPREHPDDYWFVHYSNGSGPLHLGAGTVMIIERRTGKVVYDGTDGGE